MSETGRIDISCDVDVEVNGGTGIIEDVEIEVALDVALQDEDGEDLEIPFTLHLDKSWDSEGVQVTLEFDRESVLNWARTELGIT